MKGYKKIDYLFSGLHRHMVRSLSKAPENSDDDEDDILIEGIFNCIMDEGPDIELCLWTADGMSFWDVSVEKEGSGLTDEEAFLSYLRSKELPLENTEDKYGYWRYCGVLRLPDIYRVQYFEAEQ